MSAFRAIELGACVSGVGIEPLQRDIDAMMSPVDRAYVNEMLHTIAWLRRLGVQEVTLECAKRSLDMETT